MVAAYPSGNGKPGEVILVNEDFNQNPEQATWNFIHAIAHSLGLKHAVNNSSSIMHRGDFRKNFPNFSNSFPTSYDEINISSMYPININSIIQPSIRGYNGVFSLSYVSIEDGISYHWKIIGTSGSPYFYEEVGTSTLSDMYLAKGNYRVECTISGTKYLTSVTATKNISIQ
ncbi:hypothetical protein Pedsa_3799 [Pseudopedobacter saltans DSM 12145]|uniref:Uncharacterized protein n=1 Tax=Pseudopedobacter saltans (strain ATCC 51119 / DSM 12145 / JCM 21818 / CCUG 39354 / LMG 10337 / NBRC 100064 / NCIMB 13643) TaxID=762903 RepID=F0S755_PSESL|nr:hypothetical protein [Pseudopedobacter saltans]ADY54328.1 hypothetical protein Pedsa_3799 [Pseudopedobacter saltans DSM 12145]